MRVIVTRPAAQAAPWVTALRAAGLDAVALPLIDISAPDDPTAVQAAWAGLSRQALVFFVSPNAVQHFFAGAPAGAVWPAGVQAGSTGPGTSAALRAAGVPSDLVVAPAPEAPSFDAEALWTRIADAPWAGRRVLVVRGENGRDWLAEQFRGRGAQVAFVAAYRRSAPRLAGPAAQCLADAAARPAEHLWLFSSSEAIANLCALAPTLAGPAAQALASHPRIAQTARAAGFGRVEVCAPMLENVTQALKAWSIQSNAS